VYHPRLSLIKLFLHIRLEHFFLSNNSFHKRTTSFRLTIIHTA
jgi:hypothetical protein